MLAMYNGDPFDGQSTTLVMNNFLLAMRLAFLIALAGILSGCIEQPYPVNLAMKNLVTHGFDASFTLTGSATPPGASPMTVSGHGTYASVPAITATFDNSTVLDAALVSNGTVTFNGQTTPLQVTIHQYFDSLDTRPRGQIDTKTGEHYVVTAFAGWPTAAKVGDSGQLGSVTIYADYTRAIITGYQQWSYKIEPETQSTAIFAWTIVETDVHGGNSLTQTDRYRITPTGEITFLSSRGTDDSSDLTLSATSVRTPGMTPAPVAWQPPSIQAYSLGGTIKGLATSGLVLSTGTESTSVTPQDLTFKFPTLLPTGASYNVSVQTQPIGQTCSVSNDNGTMGSGHIWNVVVTCISALQQVTGTISGLSTSGLWLSNGSDTLLVAPNSTSFAFPSQTPTGANYMVAVKSQPNGLLCSVANQSGTLGVSSAPPSITCDAVIAHCPAGSNGLFFNGDSSDYIHPGRESLNNANWSASGSPQALTIGFNNSSHWWYLSFSSQQLGQTLAVHTYDQAERAAFASLGHPGLEVYGDHRGCNILSGSFQIHAITWNGPTLKNFTASFEQHCEGLPAALRGCVHFEQ